ncbi:MAG: hypothetical protein AAF600_18570, partial [Bacteroidota bacterium]
CEFLETSISELAIGDAEFTKFKTTTPEVSNTTFKSSLFVHDKVMAATIKSGVILFILTKFLSDASVTV